LNVGGEQVPVVLADLTNSDVNDYDSYAQIGYKYNSSLDKYTISDTAADFVVLGEEVPTIELPGALKPVFDYGVWSSLAEERQLSSYPLFTIQK